MKRYRVYGRELGHVIASRGSQFRETPRFYLRGNTLGLACLLVVFLFCSPAAPQTGGLPTSIGWSSLPANTSLAASGACPSNGFGGDPFPFAEYCQNVIRAWSGGVADTVANRLIIWGGGSSSYYGNEIYSLNLTANPVTLTRLKDPTVPTNYANRIVCIDGLPPGNSTFAPNSRDTFGGLAFIANSDSLFATGGALACVFGSSSHNTWTISLNNVSNSTSWQDRGPGLSGTLPGSNGGGAYGNVAAYDPNTGLVFVSDAAALYTYNLQTNSYAQITPTEGFLTDIHLSVAIDPTRKLFVMVGACEGGTCASGTGVFVADISNPASTTQQNWTAATLADSNCAEFLSGGVNAIGSACPGFTFDSVANDFVGWPNQGNSVYILTPDPVNQRLTCQKQTFASGPPNSAQGGGGANSSNGTFGRFQYFPGIDIFVLVNDWNIPAYVLRLRSAQSGPAVSLSPSNLTFSNQVLDTTSAAQSITLTNTGNSPLTVTSITPAGDYAETDNCITRSPIAPSAGCTISVTFTPLGVGTLSGSLTIKDNASVSQQVVNLMGAGVSAPVPVASLSVSSLNFGNQDIGTSSSPMAVTLGNTGTAPLTITGITASGDFSQANNCGTSLVAGTQCSIAVTFTPSTTGARTGTLTIQDNGGSGTQTVGLSGAGIQVTLTSINITPTNATVVIGTPQQFTAAGTFSDGSIKDITNTASWSSSNTRVATVSTTGLVSGVTTGTITLSAQSGSVIGSVSVSVTGSSTGLPTGIGWHALATDTSLEGSGACPPDYFGGDPFPFADLCANVIRTWNGAIADTTANRLIIWGGGHDNYYGNEIYSLNLTANPITLTRDKDPTVPTNYANRTTCVEGIPPGSPDFAPNSRESYGGLAFIPGPYQMFITGGSLACNLGGQSRNTWTISLNNLSNASSWVDENLTLVGPLPASDGGDAYGMVADYDPNSGLVFLSDAAAIYSYNYQTNTYARVSPPEGFVTDIYLSGAIDPSRKLFVLVGGCTGGTCGPGDGVFVADISNPASTTQQNWTAATMANATCAEFLSGGVNPIGTGNPGITFDSVAKDFVGWPNQGNGVYILTPDPTNQRLTCQKMTFTGGPPNSSHANDLPNTTYGTYGRFRYFPGLDVFVLINDWDVPAYILRLR
jgi:hypothetical protein